MKIFSKKLIASILTIIMCVSSVAFVAAENSDAITISATETTTINLDDATLNDKIEVNHNGTGNYKFGTGAAATFTVNVEEAGSYKMRANILTRDQYMNTWNVYIDDVKHGTFYSWITAGFWCDNEVLDLYFDEAGEHTIKIDMTLGNAYLNNFTLTKEEYDFKSISILGKNATGTGFANNMEKYQITNGNNANQYAEYSVNIETDGVYRITSQTTYNETELKSALITVNGIDKPYIALSILSDIMDL